VSTGKWEKLYEYAEHSNSVNCLSFCPYEYGLILVCGSTDGSISIHEYKSTALLILDDNWTSASIKDAHANGVNCLAWASFNDEAKIHSNNLTQLKFISGGNDCNVRVWTAKENNFGYDINSFNNEISFIAHDDSIKDLIWKYNPEQNSENIITSGEV
jgi:protein transport protein SEC13